MTFKQLQEKIGKQKRSDWHQHANGGGWVHRTAKVSKTARVTGNARVYGDAWGKSPLFIVGSSFSLTNCKRGFIQIGCHSHSFNWWLKHGMDMAKEHNFTTEQIREYRGLHQAIHQNRTITYDGLPVTSSTAGLLSDTQICNRFFFTPRTIL